MPQASRSVGCAVVGTALVLSALAVAATPASAAFARTKAIEIDRSRVPGTANHVDFPVLVSITADANLRTTANGGSVTSAQGHDILFRGEDATTSAPAPSPCRLDITAPKAWSDIEYPQIDGEGDRDSNGLPQFPALP